MVTSQLIQFLECAKDLLGDEKVGDQSKPAEKHKASTSAARAKLAELQKKLTASRTDATKIKATGAGK